MVPANFGCASTVLAAITMLARSRAQRSAMDRPIPRLAPVMKIVLSFSVATRRIPSPSASPLQHLVAPKSISPEHGSPLLHESGHALGEIPGPRTARERSQLLFQLSLQRAAERVVHETFSLAV